ncbi:bacteriocin [Pseudoalteromonas sp. S16_S37]|uniref:bacteriocin n=1 Tax=Pseudoalteromonas sp. S16_S37 TaxID=2720228 RepID=UPI0016802A75|nr:bacteriocin [Pseudoalteromonas sp. S16_S37]MBD1584849.1 bacteriocin [Pseudoalteromonas sp. S16_S37]
MKKQLSKTLSKKALSHVVGGNGSGNDPATPPFSAHSHLEPLSTRDSGGTEPFAVY